MADSGTWPQRRGGSLLQLGERVQVGLQLGVGTLQPDVAPGLARAALLAPVSSLPRQAAQRIHGRELHYYLNLSRPLHFAASSK